MDISSKIILLCLLPTFAYGQLRCECACNCPENENQAGNQTVEFEDNLYEDYVSPYIFEDGLLLYCSETNQRERIAYFESCCWETEIKFICNRGPENKCQRFCPGTASSDCTCQFIDIVDDSEEYSYPLGKVDESDDSSKILGIGIGVGLGIAVLLAVVVGIMAYCRITGRREGRKESSEIGSDRRQRRDESEYAEISGNTQAGRHINAVSNQGYNTSVEIIGRPYQSLKKPNQDMGTADYMDPEKYTEPPVLPKRNSAISGDRDDDEEYVSQGTPPLRRAKSQDLSAQSKASSHDYAINSTSNDSVKSNNSSIMSQDSITSYNLYVSVDHDDPDQSKAPSEVKNLDYVDVDDHSLGKKSTGMKSSDYVNVDDKKSSTKLNDQKSSDYVGVDDD